MGEHVFEGVFGDVVAEFRPEGRREGGGRGRERENC
jgi:hypothetical protein